jgi:hypothetical protein
MPSEELATNCPGCPEQVAAIVRHAAAMEEIAAALNRTATAIETGVAEIKPAAHFFVEAGGRLDALCRFLTRKGPWILASIPPVLVAVGAVSPNAAAAMKSFFAILAGH